MEIRNVVIVDDDESIRDIFKLALENKGYMVFTARDGGEALELLHKIPGPSLVILDLMMPVMSGWELAKLIRGDEKLADDPIVVISAFDTKSDTIDSEATLRKPVELENLLRTVARFCPKLTEGGHGHT